jgi:cell division protein FtsQ
MAGIDPRLRARRIEVRRQEGRRRLYRLAALGVLGAVAVVGYLATRSPFLDVDRITVTGNSHTTVDAIRMSSGIHRHEPMTDVDLDRARTGILALPWVRTVSVTRSWPASVHIVVTERAAVAAIPLGPKGFATVDTDGTVLETSPAPPPQLVLLGGVPDPGAPGSALDPSAGDALRTAAALPASLRTQVATVAVTPAGVDLKLVDGGVAHLGDATELQAKLVAVDTVLANVDQTGLCSIDARVPSAPSLTRGGPCA